MVHEGFRRALGLAATCCAVLATSALAEVPLTKDATRHVMVPAFVNGKGPFPFMLDTGADESAAYAWFAKSLNLPKGGKRELNGATGSVAMTGTLLSELRIDGHALHNIDADTIPDRPDHAQIAGVAGADMMAGKLAVLDFGCGKFALLPLTDPFKVVGAKAVFVKAGAIPDGKQLTLPVAINGVTGVAMLDSGARASIVNTNFARAAGVDISKFHGTASTRGAAGQSVNAAVGPIGTVRFTGIVRDHATARVADLPSLQGMDRAMILGLDLLQGTRLTIDYRARRFWVGASVCPEHG